MVWLCNRVRGRNRVVRGELLTKDTYTGNALYEVIDVETGYFSQEIVQTEKGWKIFDPTIEEINQMINQQINSYEHI